MKKDATALNLATLEKPSGVENTFTIRLGNPNHSQLQLFIKRSIDLLSSLLIFTLGAPFLLIMAALVRFTSRGPILYRQVRMGRHGKPFNFYKFRTMYHGNDESVHRSFAQNFINGHVEEDRSANVYKMVRDPRVTPVGRLLRRASLDELPQFWNVLRGEMSLVGPRPPIHYEMDHYQDWHKDRLRVRPGLTGLWQVSGRSSVPFDEMVMLDLHYISHWSLALDLKIAWKTIPVMVRGEGAY